MRTSTRRAAGALVVAGLLAACSGSGSTGPLPPIPATAGVVMPRSAPVAPPRDGQTTVDRVVAVVNDEAIFMSELQEAMALLQRDARTPPPAGPELVELQRRVLDRMIAHRLQVQEARREKIEIAEEDLRAAIDDFVRRNGGDRARVEEQLQAQGISWESLRRELRDQLMAQRIRGRRVVRRVQVTEAEVDAYLAENQAKLATGLKYHARHIAVLAQPPESAAAWERARAEIEAIAGALREGGDFGALARERSRDASAAAGGDLGWLARGELEPLFEAPLLALSPGGVTAPIRSAVGYHLFKLDEREELSPAMLAEARQQARDLLQQRKGQERLDEWVETLRRRALISTRL